MGQRGEEETVQLWPFTLSMDIYLAPGVLEAPTARHLMCTISRSWPWALRATQSGEQTVLAGEREENTKREPVLLTAAACVPIPHAPGRKQIA